MSLSPKEIKYIRSLKEKKFRDLEGVFAVEGEKMVSEALESAFEVVRVYRREEIGEETMSRISSLSSPSPALAVVRKPQVLEDSAALPSCGLFFALDGIRDPGNMGTILRIADWFGLDGVFASQDSVDVFNPKVVQSTMGAIFRVPFRYCGLPSLCRRAAAAGGSVWGTFLHGEDIYRTALDGGRTAPSIIVIGNESSGISSAVAEEVTGRLFIPPFPEEGSGSESLNAAVAAAITAAEFRRRDR